MDKTDGDGEPKTVVAAESKAWGEEEGSGILLRRSLKFASSSRALHESLSRELWLCQRRERVWKKKRERKAGQWVDRRDSKDSTLFPFPSFNSCPSLQMLVSRAHAGKGFFPLFFLLSFSLSFLLSLFLAFLLRLIVEGVALKFFVRTVR